MEQSPVPSELAATETAALAPPLWHTHPPREGVLVLRFRRQRRPEHHQTEEGADDEQTSQQEANFEPHFGRSQLPNLSTANVASLCGGDEVEESFKLS